MWITAFTPRSPSSFDKYKPDPVLPLLDGVNDAGHGNLKHVYDNTSVVAVVFGNRGYDSGYSYRRLCRGEKL